MAAPIAYQRVMAPSNMLIPFTDTSCPTLMHQSPLLPRHALHQHPLYPPTCHCCPDASTCQPWPQAPTSCTPHSFLHIPGSINVPCPSPTHPALLICVLPFSYMPCPSPTFPALLLRTPPFSYMPHPSMCPALLCAPPFYAPHPSMCPTLLLHTCPSPCEGDTEMRPLVYKDTPR